MRRAARRGDGGDVAVGVKAESNHAAARECGLGDAACGIALVYRLLGERVGDGLHQAIAAVADGEGAEVCAGPLGDAGDAASNVVAVVHGFDTGDLGEGGAALGVGLGGGDAGGQIHEALALEWVVADFWPKRRAGWRSARWGDCKIIE